MGGEDVNLNLNVNDQASAALKNVAEAVDRAAAAQKGMAAGLGGERHNPDLDAAFGVTPDKAARSAPPPAPPRRPVLPQPDLFMPDKANPKPPPKPPDGSAGPTATVATAAADMAAVTAAGADALTKLADTIGKVAEAEKKMTAETRKLTQQQDALQKQKDAFEAKQKADRARERATPTRGEQARNFLGGAAKFARGGATGGLDALGGAASLGKAAPWMAAAAAAAAVFESALQRGAAALNIFNSGALTSAQKLEALREEFVPFYQSIKKFREAMDGTTESIARNQRERAAGLTKIGAAGTQQSKTRDFEFPLQEHAETARAYAAFGELSPLKTFDRSTAVGERRSSEQDMTYEKYDAAGRADIEARAARSGHNRQLGFAADAGAVARADAEAARAAKKKLMDMRAEEEKTGVRNKASKDGGATPGIDEAAKNAQLAEAKAAQSNAQWQAEIARSKETGMKATQAEHTARLAAIEAAKAELEILKQREARMAGLARSVGRMTTVEREMSEAMLNEVKAHVAGGGDIGELPAEFVDQAAKLAPEFIGKQQEKSGADYLKGAAGRQKGIDDSTLQDFERTTLAEVRAQVDKVKVDMRVSIQADAKAMADDFMALVGPTFKDWKASLLLEVEGMIRAQIIGQVQRQNLDH